ncbi:ABC transporter substrate-binding protein [Nonomuraea sediminis]|uniref:ABC transporter substrate-binding protein n=1 Tax=Nonomuraea sediminis TaxID=2835864 RepID=UPI001BDD4B29|nr:ABC transporter substrate-binding protein [Nonomuraea sediminis]
MRALLLAVPLLLAAACGTGGAVQDARQLTIAVDEQFDGFEPTDLAGTNVQAGVMRQLYDTLTLLDADRNVQPRLAQSWKQGDGGRTLTFTLRPGLKFSDGTPLTAKDVVWNVQHAQSAATGATARPLFLTTQGAAAPDPATVRVTFRKPLAAPFDLFDYLFIAKPQDGRDQLKNHPVGSGPFLLQSWQPASQAVLAPNPHFWRQGVPKLERLVFRVTGDAQSSRLLFQSGQAGFLFDSSWQDFANFAKDPSVQTLQAGEGGRVEMLLMNTAKPPFDDVRVRQAVAAALDRKAIVGAVYKGRTEPWCLPWPKGSIGFDASPEQARSCPPDPAKAKRLLAQAGHGSGLDASILTGGGVDEAVSQILQQQLAAVGVRARIDLVDDAMFNTRIDNGDWTILTSNVQRVAHDSGSSIVLGQPLANGSVHGYSSGRYAKLIDDALHEPDRAQRLESLRQINDLLLNEDFFVAITTQTPHYVYARDVHGLQVTLDGYLILENVELR